MGTGIAPVDCDLCEFDYYQSNIFFDDGVQHSVCLKEFCGTEGYGSTCLIGESTNLNNCRKGESISLSDGTLYDTCIICEPGFYKYVYAAVMPGNGEDQLI